MALDLAQLRPAYNGSALVSSFVPALWWGHELTNSVHGADGLAPLGLTAAAVIVTSAAAWTMPIWPTRALQFAPLTALLVSPAAVHAILTFTNGVPS